MHKKREYLSAVRDFSCDIYGVIVMPILNSDLAKDCDIIVKMIISVEESESVWRMVEGT